MPNLEQFKKELTILLNQKSLDNWCGMHDFVLADLISQTLTALAQANHEEVRLRG